MRSLKSSLFLSLIASTALSGAALAQTATGTDFGTVVVAPPVDAAAQPGLTASPADLAAARDKARQRQVIVKKPVVAKNKKAGPATANAAPTAAATAAVSGPVSTVGASAATGVTGTALGGGYIINEQAKKSRSTVVRDAIAKQSPTSNPYQLINLLPGVVGSSTDNTGLNGGNIRLRGFNSDHVGLTIEGAPINDSGNYALFPQEYVDAENIEQVSIAQGSPDLDSPHIGAVGGVINVYMRDPLKEAGGFTDLSIGSNNLKREFIRGESGQIGKFRSYLSYSHLSKDDWAGPGGDNRDHVDFRGVYDINSGNTVRLSAIYNSAINTFYRNPTMAQFQTPGFQPGYLGQLPSDFFNISGNINQSPKTAQLDPQNSTEYYKYRINPFKNLILSAPSNFTITDKVKFDTTPYYWYGFGNGGGVSSLNEKNGVFWGNVNVKGVNYNPAVNGTKTDTGILYYNPSITETNRPGVINKFTYDAGSHKIIAGNWFEYAIHRQTAPYEALNSDGSVVDPFATNNNFVVPPGAICTVGGVSITCPVGPLERRDQITKTMTNALFVGDTWKATDQLTFDYGVKQVWVNRVVDNQLPGGSVLTLNDQATLPTGGVSYQLTPENKLFASFATSFRSAPNFTLIPFINNATGQVTPAGSLAPENGKSFEIGHRFQGSMFATSVSAFYGTYQHFQQQTRIADPSGGSSSGVNATIDVGGVTNYGLDAEIGTASINHFRPYASVELLRAELKDNLPVITATNLPDVIATAGKQLPGSPNYQFGLGLDYDNGHLLGNIAYKYIGPQYSSFINDEQNPAYGKVDMMIGYRFDNVGFLKAPEVKLNLFNVRNTNQLTGVNGITNNALVTQGLNTGANVNGSAPTYFQGQGFSALLNFSSAF